MELEALQAILPEIKKAGATLAAISPMLVKYTPQLVKKLGLEFPVLSDPGHEYLASLGLVHSLPAELIEVYKGFGIDMERFNGDSDWRLPLPGRIIVDRTGIIRDVSVSTNHIQRPEPAESLELLKNL